MRFLFIFTFIVSIVFIQTLYAQSNGKMVIQTPINGHEIRSYQNDELEVEIYFVDRSEIPFTGTYIVLNENRDTMSRCSFKDGLPHGEHIIWETTICLFEEDTYYRFDSSMYENGVLRHQMRWSCSGDVVSIINYDSNGELHGPYIGAPVFYAVEINYVHGQIDGTFKSYYDNGQIMCLDHYKMGKEHGLHTDYFENGNKEREDTYVDGIRHGSFRKWLENGTRWYYCDYVDGLKNGLEIEHDQYGRIKYEYEYENGLKNGQARKWNEDGELILFCEYLGGFKNGKELVYHDNGVLFSEGNYIKGRRTGRFVFYNEDGSFAEETDF
jgi:uncharacterized protein